MQIKLTSKRKAPIEIEIAQFRQMAYTLVDEVASFLENISHGPVTSAEPPSAIRRQLGQTPLPHEETSASELLKTTSELLFNHSLFNGHPRFWGYITSSAAPIGILGEMLAAAVNPNVGAYVLSPVATEIERQTIRWIAELIGYPSSCGGIFVSGGNMANFVGFLAARKAKATWDVRKEGLAKHDKLLAYCSTGTHTWIQKATDIFGFGTNCIRWIETDDDQRMKIDLLKKQIDVDRQNGFLPFLVVGTAGSVGTGSVDPLNDIAEVCSQNNLWFHVDGAYGAPAAMLEEQQSIFKGMEKADSIALDPHKWLYSPLEAGCVLLREADLLHNTFTFKPEYYKFDGTDEDPVMNFHEFGLQNSRGFRALKVWLSIQQVGRNGYVKMIRDDITLASRLFQLAEEHEELEAITHSLSITTFRYVPKEKSLSEDQLNKLNEKLLSRIQNGGEAFLSNAIVNGKYCLRACIVNFRTSIQDINALIEIVVRLGRET